MNRETKQTIENELLQLWQSGAITEKFLSLELSSMEEMETKINKK